MYSADRFREVFKSSYVSRGRYRVSRRNLEDLAKQAKIGRELVPLYLEVVEWQGFKRIIAVKT
ncbi:hypothetical protein ACSU1N_03525 [Thermogladius sp. 4427co]|uniref:hypothetical protein n=1 Tax=Thermogladius sp. 4427co TaxID=3450718 RepID=UPI003F7B2D2B